MGQRFTLDEMSWSNYKNITKFTSDTQGSCFNGANRAEAKPMRPNKPESTVLGYIVQSDNLC